MSLGYALVFKLQTEYFISLDLLKMAKQSLSLAEDQLDVLVQNDSLLISLFNSKLVQCLASNLNLDNLMDNPGMDHAVKHVATARKSITWRGAPRGSIYRIDASEARVGLFFSLRASFTDPIVISCGA